LPKAHFFQIVRFNGVHPNVPNTICWPNELIDGHSPILDETDRRPHWIRRTFRFIGGGHGVAPARRLQHSPYGSG